MKIMWKNIDLLNNLLIQFLNTDHMLSKMLNLISTLSYFHRNTNIYML